MQQSVPESIKTDDLIDLIEWLGELVRQVDSRGGLPGLGGAPLVGGLRRGGHSRVRRVLVPAGLVHRGPAPAVGPLAGAFRSVSFRAFRARGVRGVWGVRGAGLLLDPAGVVRLGRHGPPRLVPPVREDGERRGPSRRHVQLRQQVHHGGGDQARRAEGEQRRAPRRVPAQPQRHERDREREQRQQQRRVQVEGKALLWVQAAQRDRQQRPADDDRAGGHAGRGAQEQVGDRERGERGHGRAGHRSLQQHRGHDGQRGHQQPAEEPLPALDLEVAHAQALEQIPRRAGRRGARAGSPEHSHTRRVKRSARRNGTPRRGFVGSGSPGTPGASPRGGRTIDGSTTPPMESP
ncbi:DUF3516 domain-containing protein [Spirillospora sp. NPDC029432]|uniref:DUF3516 domain-containing protein n=1 Tax=Spirillospora sp. NPDC029432 TaxID=3154599 RepID=UPI003453E65C